MGHRVPKDLRPLLKAAAAAGWKVRETKGGWMLLAPNGDTVGVHKSATTSNRSRALDNFRADLRRRGVDV